MNSKSRVSADPDSILTPVMLLALTAGLWIYHSFIPHPSSQTQRFAVVSHKHPIYPPQPLSQAICHLSKGLVLTKEICVRNNEIPQRTRAHLPLSMHENHRFVIVPLSFMKTFPLESVRKSREQPQLHSLTSLSAPSYAGVPLGLISIGAACNAGFALSPINPLFFLSIALITHCATSSSSVPLPAPISFFGITPSPGDRSSS